MIQLRWYAEQLFLDEKEDFDAKRDFIEYLASFTNSKAVQEIKRSRESAKDHKFANDEEFERQLLNKDYMDNPYVDAIVKIRKAEAGEDANNPELNERKLRQSGIKLPTNLNFLKDI